LSSEDNYNEDAKDSSRIEYHLQIAQDKHSAIKFIRPKHAAEQFNNRIVRTYLTAGKDPLTIIHVGMKPYNRQLNQIGLSPKCSITSATIS
jgi:hypothetical protein